MLAPGAHVFAVRATDPAGNTDQTPAELRFDVPPPDDGGVTPPPPPPPPPPVAPDLSAPRLTAIDVSRRRGGALLRLTTSEPATLTLTIERAVRGRRAGRRCVPLRAGERTRRPCRVHRRLRGSRGHALVAGRNAIRIKGLRAGRYRARGVAVDAAGNRRKLAPVAFTVARRRP